MLNKRPTAFSDSHIYIGNYNFDTVQEFNNKIQPLITSQDSLDDKNTLELVLREPDNILSLNSTNNIQTPVHVSTYIHNAPHTYLKFTIDYLMRFIFHIFLISIFEVVFFFAFVSKDEDQGILLTTNYYSNSIINSCSKFNITEREILNFILSKFVNSTQIITVGKNAAKIRSDFNSQLFILAWEYVGILAFIQTCLVFISYHMKFKIKWSNIILENLALVVFLGIYEFMFFETIIKKYTSETPQEISALFINGLQQQCGILDG